MRQRFKGTLGVCAAISVLTISGGANISTALAQQVVATAAPSAQPRNAAARAAKRKPLPVHKDAGRPFIEFRSRYALSYGHTFVVFGRLNERGEIGEIKPEMVAGLHPAGEGPELWTVGHMVPVPSETGWSDGDLEEEYVSARYRVMLSEEDFARLTAHIEHKKANSPLWHAVFYNCNRWTGEIAEFLGLKTGFRWQTPAEYINTMRELNSPGEGTAWATGSPSTTGSSDTSP